MKARRHVVTALVFLVAAGLLGSIAWRLRSAAGDDAAADSRAAADSVKKSVASTAAQGVFSTEIALPVEGARVRRDTFVAWVQASGEAAPVRRAALPAEVAGPVSRVYVREGEPVRKGQLLLALDSTAYQLAVDQAQAAVEKARADFQSLVLYEEQIQDSAARAERRRQARVRSGLAGAEIELEQKRLDLARTRVRAPFAGRAANMAVTSGSRVRQGDSLVTVVDLSRVDVDVQVLETQLPEIEVGRRATASLAAFPGESFDGKVVTINPVVDPAANSGRVTVRLANPDARILPGMHAELRIAGRLSADRTFVRRPAIVERDRRDVVFVFQPDSADPMQGSAEWNYVTTGLENDEYVEIVPGEDTKMLEPGQIVLTGGHATLVHDAKVRLVNADSLGIGGAGRAG